METHHSIDDYVPNTARCVLVAVHGHEPIGWASAVFRALTMSPETTVRVLAVVDVPAPPSVRLEALLAGLAVVPDVTWVDVPDADPGGAIVERAAALGADLIVVGVDRASWPERLFLGAIHEQVIARAGCAVLVVPAAERGAQRRWRGALASRRRRPRPAAAKGGA
jgi:nucleotide-binding universal stress UspA family protein